ncbi:MAG: aspartyl protease family protein [Micropepsaceae bacterium]
MTPAHAIASILLLLALCTAAAARDLQTVTAQTKAAAGGAALDKLTAIRITYRLRQAGLEGTGTTLTDVVTGRTVTRFKLGPMSGAEGFDGRRTWLQDTAGIVTVPEGGDRRAQTVSAQYRNALGYWYPARTGPARVGFRIQLFRSRVKEALEVAPQGGLPFELWFDAQTKMLDRVIEVGATETRTTSYEDYRPIGGLLIAHRIRTSNAAAAFGTERVVTKVELNPAEADFAIPPPPKPDFAFGRGARESVQPFRFVNNHIYVDVKLNGRPFALLLDTGASNVITPTVARALRLRPVGDARVWGSGDASEAAAFTRIDTMAVGNVRFKNQLFAVVPLESLSEIEGLPFHGMIGYEIFKRLVAKVDYDAQTVTLSDPAVWRADGAGTPVPFVFNGTVPEIEGDIDGIKAAFDIDTGSRMSVGLYGPFVLRHGLRGRFKPSIETVTGWGLGGPSSGTVARVKRVRLGTIAVNDVVVDMSRQTQGILSHAAPSGSIGSGLLKRFTVTFDYPRQQVYFAPAARTQERDAYDRSGLWINQARGGFRVVDVVERSPAALAGLREGDTITAVDGAAAASMSLGNVRDRLRDGAPGTEVRLTILRERHTQVVALRLRDLF